MDSEKKSPLDVLDFLIGNWQALSDPEGPTGGFSFEAKLQGRILLRTNHADYAPTEERPAERHEDLMIIHAGAGGELLADYYDSEGHVIRYAGEANENGRVTFTSTTPGPRFRLSYRLAPDGTLAGAFEVSSPAEPDRFNPYLSWAAVRVPGPLA